MGGAFWKSTYMEFDLEKKVYDPWLFAYLPGEKVIAWSVATGV